MSTKLPDRVREKIWRLSCSYGAWCGDPQEADLDPLPLAMERVKDLDEDIDLYLGDNISAEEALPLYKLMLSTMIYAAEIERHKRENQSHLHDFEKQRDNVAKVFPFTDEENNRWAGRL